jgi:hypothetical protein
LERRVGPSAAGVRDFRSYVSKIARPPRATVACAICMGIA